MTAATAEARRRAQIARRIAELVEAAPPLSDEQVETLRRLLGLTPKVCGRAEP